jgi:hypothetical protein
VLNAASAIFAHAVMGEMVRKEAHALPFDEARALQILKSWRARKS